MKRIFGKVRKDRHICQGLSVDLAKEYLTNVRVSEIKESKRVYRFQEEKIGLNIYWSLTSDHMDQVAHTSIDKFDQDDDFRPQVTYGVGPEVTYGVHEDSNLKSRLATQRKRKRLGSNIYWSY